MLNVLSRIVVGLAVVGLSAAAHADDWIITKNPYEKVDWDTFEHYKSSLHNHTTNSDGRQSPTAVIDGYYEADYDILAITDHNHVTWPWQRYNRVPEELEMLAVQANEYSRHHHTNGFFTGYPQPIRDASTNDLEITLRELEELGAPAHLNHPGRYWDPEDGQVPDSDRRFYGNLFRAYPNLVGMEIHNQGDRYPEDRILWDALLSDFMPRRGIWGFANDDSHGSSHIGLNANFFLMPEMTESEMRLALQRGQFYASTVTTHDNADRDWTHVPRIVNVAYRPEDGRLRVRAESGGSTVPGSAYTWISAGGEIVQEGGGLIDLNELEGLDRYLRVEIVGEGGTTYSQPFGVRQRDADPARWADH